MDGIPSRIWLGALFILASSRVWCQQSSASITGVVLVENNTPVPGALVLYNRVREYRSDTMGRPIAAGLAVNSGTRTNGAGAFTISGIPPGSYYMCAYPTQAGQLPSCEWEQPALRVELLPGQTIQNITLQVVQGTLVLLRVIDARGLIQEVQERHGPDGRLPLQAGNFRIGVVSGSRYARARLVSHIGAVREYAVAVPRTASVRLLVSSPLAIIRPSGEPVERERPSLPIAPAGQAQVSLDLEVQ
jgi:hypothetical protein